MDVFIHFVADNAQWIETDITNHQLMLAWEIKEEILLE
jgi:hypothetical protein